MLEASSRSSSKRNKTSVLLKTPIAAVPVIRSEGSCPGACSDNEDDGDAAAQLDKDEGANDVYEATRPTAAHSVQTEDSPTEPEDGYLNSQGPENPSPQPEDGYPNTQDTDTSSAVAVLCS